MSRYRDQQFQVEGGGVNNIGLIWDKIFANLDDQTLLSFPIFAS